MHYKPITFCFQRMTLSSVASFEGVPESILLFSWSSSSFNWQISFWYFFIKDFSSIICKPQLHFASTNNQSNVLIFILQGNKLRKNIYIKKPTEEELGGILSRRKQAPKFASAEDLNLGGLGIHPHARPLSQLSFFRKKL